MNSVMRKPATAPGRAKVVVFDCWTKGTPHVVRLLDAAARHGLEVVMVHYGSWGDDIERPTEEIIDGLPVRDIRGYAGFADVLDQERPDAVLLLSLDMLLHRAFNRHCRFRGIPTVHLYSGLWSAQAYDQLGINTPDLARYWRWQMSRATRSLRLVIPTYVAALLQTRARLGEWGAFVAEVWSRLIGSLTVEVPPDARPGSVCVFNHDDRSHAIEKFRLPPDRITVVGVPDILKFRQLEESIGHFAGEFDGEYTDVVYIGTGIRGSRMKIAEDADYVEHLSRTARILKKAGLNLVLKLHYSRLDGVKSAAAAAGERFDLCDDEDFVARLAASAGAIVEPSSAGLVPILMGKPIYLAQYGRLADLPFGRLLTRYPKASPLVSLDDLAAIGGRRRTTSNQRDTIAWIQSVAGPLPAREMPDRVARVLLAAIEEGRAAQ